MEDQKIKVSTLGRAKDNIWLLVLSLFTIIAMFTSIYYHAENIKSKQRLNDVKAKLQLAEQDLIKINEELTSTKNELTVTNANLASAKKELKRKKDVLTQAGKNKIQSMNDLAYASYQIRNDIEDVEHGLEGVSQKKELNKIRAGLTTEKNKLNKIRADLTNSLDIICNGLNNIITRLLQYQK